MLVVTLASFVAPGQNYATDICLILDLVQCDCVVLCAATVSLLPSARVGIISVPASIVYCCNRSVASMFGCLLGGALSFVEMSVLGWRVGDFGDFSLV